MPEHKGPEIVLFLFTVLVVMVYVGWLMDVNIWLSLLAGVAGFCVVQGIFMIMGRRRRRRRSGLTSGKLGAYAPPYLQPHVFTSSHRSSERCDAGGEGGEGCGD